MKELSIDELRKIQLDILNEFKRVCEENNLQYFLSNGTLLGAVKYNGYIPWDDDVDVCMKREDYLKLLNVYKDSDKYTLFSHEKNSDYLFPFAKLSNNETILIEQCVDNGVQLGVNVDIFPLDGYGNSKSDADRIFNKMQKLRRRLSRAKILPRKNDNLIKKLVKKLLSAFNKLLFGTKRCVKKLDRLAKSLSVKDCNLMGNTVWGFYGSSEAFRKEVFSEGVVVIFENGQYVAPKDSDTYLRGLYGDYKLDPPKEKQVTHHNFNAYKKD